MTDGNRNNLPVLFGAHQIGFEGAASEDEIEKRTRHMLARSLNSRNAIAFVGSGISNAYGHPRWDDLAFALVEYTLDKRNEISLKGEEEGMLNSFIKGERSSHLTSEDQKLVILELCNEICRRKGRDAYNAFRNHIAAVTNGNEAGYRGDIRLDPLKMIMERLEIERFITTNYDNAIEGAFIEVLGCRIMNGNGTNDDSIENRGSHAVRPIARSLVFGPENSEALLQFAVASPDFERGVFHIHGKVPLPSGKKSHQGKNSSNQDHDPNKEPPLLVVTEGDYQRTYLQNLDSNYQTYREALKIVFEGNPILFLGLGMKEIDLLRPLRQFVSERARSAYERPLFALFERLKNKNEEILWRRYLYTKYAIKVLYYGSAAGNASIKELCNEIGNLRDICSDAEEGDSPQKHEKNLNKLRQGINNLQQGYYDVVEKKSASKDPAQRIKKLRKEINNLQEICNIRDDDAYQNSGQYIKRFHDGIDRLQHVCRGDFIPSQDHDEITGGRLDSDVPHKEENAISSSKDLDSPLQRDIKTKQHPLTVAFCEEIGERQLSWYECWEDWKKIPLVRRPFFSEPQKGICMVRHCTDISYIGENGTLLSSEQERRSNLKGLLRRQLELPGTAMILLGQAGSGKGTIAQLLAERPESISQELIFHRRFFATAHFTNDLLSIIEGAANFFLGSRKIPGNTKPIDSLDRLRQALEWGKYLLVIGGLERLLVPHRVDENSKKTGEDGNAESKITAIDQPDDSQKEPDEKLDFPIGKSSTYEVRRFLDLINRIAAEGSMKGNIVLTSSMWPLELSDKIFPIKLEGISVGEAQGSFFRNIDKDIIEQLHRALNGHSYALAVIREVMNSIENENDKKGLAKEQEQWARKLVATLTAIDHNARPIKVIELALKRLMNARKSKRRGGESLLTGLIQRVALFSTPASTKQILASYPTRKDEVKIGAAVKYLKDNNLFIFHPKNEEYPHRVSAHTIVRNYVLKELGDMPSAVGEAQRFDLTGWSGDVPETLGGRGDSHLLTEECVDALLKKLEDNSDRNLKSDRELVRAAFGLIRSRWTATAIPRLHNIASDKITDSGMRRAYYDAYQIRLSRLMNAIRKGTGSSLQSWKEDYFVQQRDVIEKDEGYLYADELAWLYNEQAMVAFCQGFVEDAEALLRIGKEINLFAERGTHEYRWCESEITLGLVQMEMGYLNRAAEHLTGALDTAQKRLKDPELEARAKGHLALVLHLQGHYEDADNLYDKAIDFLSKNGNIRAASIFRKHYVDMLRMEEKWDLARTHLQHGVAEAQSGRYPDLVQYLRVAQVNFDLAQKKEGSVPIQNLAPMFDFARCVGIPKLEWEAQNMQAHIALKQGELELAENLVISSLATASALRLRLRLARSLCLAGEIAAKRGNRRAAGSFFRSSRDLAERQHYQLLIEQTEQHLRAEHFG